MTVRSLTSPAFTLRQVERDGVLTVLELCGRLDASVARQTFGTLEFEMATRRHLLVFIRELTYIDSTGLPPDPETWKRVARHLDGFAERTAAEQHDLVGRFAAGQLDWEDLNVSRAWSVVMRIALAEFYSHPWAFNEIGFRGPAYPRGYMRRNIGSTGRDPGEPRETVGLDPVRDFPGGSR